MVERDAVVEAAVDGIGVSHRAVPRARRLARTITTLATLAMLVALAPASPVFAGGPIFSDDFESGLSCLWSETVPIPATCSDLILNGCETDVDCGGGQCAACGIFELCINNADCQTGLCDGSICVECIFATDCPGSDTECSQRTCTGGVCGENFEPFGTPLTEQTPGDCQLAVCDGAGGTTSVPDDLDLPDDGLQCTEDVCVGGVPSFPPLPTGAPCTEGNGAVCDGLGGCVECNVASDCPGTDTECSQRTCAANACGVNFEPFGLPVAGQTTGDCQVVVCDGLGSTTSIPDDLDLPDDGQECTEDLCVGGVAMFPPYPLGFPCSGGQCDGAGNCVP